MGRARGGGRSKTFRRFQTRVFGEGGRCGPIGLEQDSRQHLGGRGWGHSGQYLLVSPNTGACCRAIGNARQKFISTEGVRIMGHRQEGCSVGSLWAVGSLLSNFGPPQPTQGWGGTAAGWA